MQDSSKPNPNGKNLQTPIMYIVFFGAGIKICICCGSGSTVNFERCVFEYLHVSMHDFFLVHLWMLKISLSFWSGWITVAKTEDLQHFYSTQPKHGDQRYWEWMGMAGIPHSYFGPQRVTKWAWNYSWKWPIEKEIRSSNLQCSGDMLVFRGVRYLYLSLSPRTRSSTYWEDTWATAKLNMYTATLTRSSFSTFLVQEFRYLLEDLLERQCGHRNVSDECPGWFRAVHRRRVSSETPFFASKLFTSGYCVSR